MWKNKHISNVLCWSDIYWRWIRAGLWCITSLYHKMVLQMNVILMYFLNNCVFWDFTKIFLFIYFCCRGWHRDIQLNLEVYQWTQPHACLWTVWGRCNTWRKQVNSTQWGRFQGDSYVSFRKGTCGFKQVWFTRGWLSYNASHAQEEQQGVPGFIWVTSKRSEASKKHFPLNCCPLVVKGLHKFWRYY